MSGEKIPDEVMKAAQEAARGMGRACGVKWENPTDEQVEPIARAIMAERSARDERAAQIVERDAEDYWDVSCVAAAIRGER